jgi:broad specificity phosphatase PhoE
MQIILMRHGKPALAPGRWLVRHAVESPVLLIGHGIMNRLIARELRSMGWKAASVQRSGHWRAVSFHAI